MCLCSGFRSTGPFVVMIYTMIRGDLLRFCLIFLVFMLGFTQALHILFTRIDCDNSFQSVIETFFHMFCVTLQQVTDAYQNINQHPISALQIIGKVTAYLSTKLNKRFSIISDVVCCLYRHGCSSLGQYAHR